MKNLLRLLGPTLMILVGLQWIQNVIVTFLLFYGWLLAVPLIDKALPKERFKVTRKAVAMGIGSGALFFLFIFGGMNWLHIYFLDIEKLRALLLEWGFSGPGEIWLVLLFLIMTPILEEVYWRGYMYEKLRINRSATQTILITAAFYTLYHFLTVLSMFTGGYSIIAVLPVFIAGLFWGYIREQTHSVAAAIIGHGFADLGIICVYWFIVR